MTTKQRLLAYLDSHVDSYQHDRHPLAYTAREVASVEHITAHRFAKTVIVYTEDGYAMAVVPANHSLDLSEMRAALGTRYLRLATEYELKELFPECDLGAMPPFGNGTLFELPVYLDEDLAAQEMLTFNAGTHRDVIRVRTKDFMRLVKPQVLSVASIFITR